MPDTCRAADMQKKGNALAAAAGLAALSLQPRSCGFPSGTHESLCLAVARSQPRSCHCGCVPAHQKHEHPDQCPRPGRKPEVGAGFSQLLETKPSGVGGRAPAGNPLSASRLRCLLLGLSGPLPHLLRGCHSPCHPLLEGETAHAPHTPSFPRAETDP